jgi:phosphoserine phosphatase
MELLHYFAEDSGINLQEHCGAGDDANDFSMSSFARLLG